MMKISIFAPTGLISVVAVSFILNASIAPADRVFFSWATYNAGPAKINNMRQETLKRGFNPNKWFYNVEKITDELIGRETVDYVSDINKYYVAYQLYFNIYTKRARVKRSIHKK
jgi:membrane-bound lytic murein transglycosylase MltF